MFQHIFGFVYLSAVSQLVSFTGAHAECPVQLNPQSVVVRYGGSVAVNCSTSVQHQGMGWEASEGAVSMDKNNSLITWRVSQLTEWDIEPYCYINHKEQCQVELPVTIYKTSDNVSISTVNHSGPMMEGKQYELQCDVHDVAPVQNLTVKWYKGQTLLDQTTFTDTIITPVNETATLLIRPDRADDGAQYRCEAELDLGAEGPQPPPKETSEPLSITVYFKPIINENKLPSVVPVFRGYSEVLVCEAEGNPKPTISWSVGTNHTTYSETLNVSESTPEYVSCNANNSAGSTTKPVKVSIQGISISFVNTTGPVIEGERYELQCFIQNVAPSKSVVVRWYKMNQTIHSDIIKTPVSNTPKLLINPKRTDDGAQFWCVAELKAEGPQRYPTMPSEHLNITVHYKPKHSSSTETIIKNDMVTLNCTVEANPAPAYTWHSDHLKEKINSSVLLSSTLSPGNYMCTATNPLGRDSKVFIVKSTGISISFVNTTGPVIEGERYELQCFIENVAPSKSVVVRWYKMNQTIHSDIIKTPVSNTPKLLINPKRTDDGAQFWCEAELKAEGPQRYPTMPSEHLNITVHYKPKHSSSTETIIKNDMVTLNCTVEANPAPAYTWHSDHLKEKINSSVLLSSTLSPGNYMCTATNPLGRDSKVFIVKSTGSRPTFWTVLSFFQLLVALMIVI